MARSERMSEEVAATFPVAVESAAYLILNVNGFGLPAAGIDGQDASSVLILIWGGASGVGAAAIQVAKDAGFEPIVCTGTAILGKPLEKAIPPIPRKLVCAVICGQRICGSLLSFQFHTTQTGKKFMPCVRLGILIGLVLLRTLCSQSGLRSLWIGLSSIMSWFRHSYSRLLLLKESRRLLKRSDV